MKKFPLLFCLILIFAGFAAAQTNPDSDCPTFDVDSGGTNQSRETLSFTAHIETKGKELKPKYRWTTSSGEIIDGQGTTAITVKPASGELVTVTLEIEGFTEGCSNIVSETGPVCSCGIAATLFNEFSIPAAQIDKAKLDALIIKLAENPNAQGYIIEYFKPNTPQKVINQKIKKITDYLIEKRFEKDRVTFVTASADAQNLTKFWLVPPGATAPTP